MIPWNSFDHTARNNVSDELRIQLTEDWLPWIEYGPTMTTVYIESPMLEIAHERQFVVTQQGGDSAGFEAEHSRRIDECLKQLEHHFHAYAIDAIHRPGSPHGIDLRCCWTPCISWEESPLRLSHSQVQPTGQPESISMPAAIPAARSALLSSAASAMVPEPDVDSQESDLSEGTADHMRSTVSRAGSTLPIHGARAQKIIRQRKRYDSKLMTEPGTATVTRKRSSQWMVDKHEDDIAIALRSQSMASLKTGHDQHCGHNSFARISRQIEDT